MVGQVVVRGRERAQQRDVRFRNTLGLERFRGVPDLGLRRARVRKALGRWLDGSGRAAIWLRRLSRGRTSSSGSTDGCGPDRLGFPRRSRGRGTASRWLLGFRGPAVRGLGSIVSSRVLSVAERRLTWQVGQVEAEAELEPELEPLAHDRVFS